jgi:Leucine-rich repeat (LRR) protein
MSLSITNLPPEMSCRIFHVLFNSYEDLETAAHPLAVTETCKDWNEMVRKILEEMWKGLRSHPPKGPLLKRILSSIPEDSVDSIQVFRELNGAIRGIFKREYIELSKQTCLFNRVQWNRIQGVAVQLEQDVALMACWPKMRGQIRGEVERKRIGHLFPAQDASADTIRKFLYLEEVLEIVGGVTSFGHLLSFTQLGLGTIPFEVALFSQLAGLNFCGNELRELTMNFNQLTHLQYLSLADNRIERLPEDFNPPNLKLLDIQLTAIGELPEALSPTVTILR